MLKALRVLRFLKLTRLLKGTKILQRIDRDTMDAIEVPLNFNGMKSRVEPSMASIEVKSRVRQVGSVT